MIFGLRSTLALGFSLVAVVLSSVSVSADETGVEVLLQEVDASPHTTQIEFSESEVFNHEVGLGAIQKLRGEWTFKDSERLSGTLRRYTWLMEDGFSSAEILEQLVDSVETLDSASELFACDGRACGRAVEWANQVFNERVLYGREQLQRYRVFALQGDSEARLLVYSAERTTSRQYLHVEWLLIAP